MVPRPTSDPTVVTDAVDGSGATHPPMRAVLAEPTYIEGLMVPFHSDMIRRPRERVAQIAVFASI